MSMAVGGDWMSVKVPPAQTIPGFCDLHVSGWKDWRQGHSLRFGFVRNSV